MNTYANRGKPFEELIIRLNMTYRNQKKAVIHKVPTEWIPLRNGTGKIVSAKVEQKAAVDFMGTYSGRSIAFDAKHTAKERISWSELQTHQAAFLDEWDQDGGISFILVSFNLQRLYVIPWTFWNTGMREWIKQDGPASLSMKQMPSEYEVKHYDYLKVVASLWPLQKSA
ncbi:MAG: recU [Firmicutes bacterium]|nr:recU [Bacillota bacterium]